MDRDEISRFKILWVGFFLTLLPLRGNLYAQQLAFQSEPADTFSLKIAYDIKELQLEMLWPHIVNLADFSEIVELKIFADEAANTEDYSLALIYLDEIFSIIQDNQSEPLLYEKNGDPTGHENPVKTVFEKEFLTGLDFSQQEYHLTFTTIDSAYLETINNPFAGFQFRWNQYQPNAFDMEFGGMYKTSRDYSLWQVATRLEKSNLSGFTFQLEQQGEGMHYTRYLPLKYWQSVSDFQIEKQATTHLSFRIEDEFQYRHYAEETETFASYWRNEYRLSAQGVNFWNSRILLGYEVDRRRQTTYTLYDYDDRRINFQHYFNPSWRTSISSWYQYREMDFPQFVSDSSFVADFKQHFFSFNAKQNIQERIALRFFFEGYFRDYPSTAVFWPDYRFLRAEPGLRLEISEKLSFGVDYLLESKKFNQQKEQNTDWFLNEDLLAEGIILSLDFFDYKNLLVSFTHTFQLNSYPNAPKSTFPGFSLFTDRKQNSTMLFVSYQVFSSLELNLILQHDLDIDQEIQNNDSRSSFFTLDFAWKL